MILSYALAELVVGSKVEKKSSKREVEKKHKDETEIQEEMQMSGNGEGVQMKVIETDSDLGASDKKVELGEKEDHEEGETEALLVLEKIR